MKRYFLISLMTCLLTSAFLSLQAQKSLPAFAFKSLEGEQFTQDQIQPELQTIVIFFDPYCDHCAQQADWIAEAADQFQEINLLWVTTELADPTVEFAETHFSETSLPHQHFLLDTEFMFDGYFGYSEVPSIYLYGSDGKRVKALHEETPAAELLDFFN